MITGVVNANREAVISLVVIGPDGQQSEIEAIIDTGFSGFPTLPPPLVTTLGLPLWNEGQECVAVGRC